MSQLNGFSPKCQKVFANFLLFVIGLAVFGQALANGCIVVRPTSNLAIGTDDAHSPEPDGSSSPSPIATCIRIATFVAHMRRENGRQRDTDVRNAVHTLDHTLYLLGQ